jgi:hypothetical protein
MADPPKPANLPVPVAQPASGSKKDERVRGGFAEFAAQILGAGVRKRGLKGGPPVIDAARTAYLETEYSGPNDRRPRTGQITRKDV